MLALTTNNSTFTLTLKKALNGICLQNLIIKASNKSVNPFSSPAKGGSIILAFESIILKPLTIVILRV
jgi:hypothetical protein